MINSMFDVTPGKVISWKKEFDNTGSDEVFISKDTFHHEEEGLDFEYKYAITLQDMYELTGDRECKNRYDLILSIVPLQKYQYPDNIRNAAELAGCEDLYDPSKPEGMPLADLVEAGFAVRVGYSCVRYRGKSTDRLLNLAASVYRVIDSMRGFYLDRCQNMFGNTGWDMLRECLFGENPFQKALEKMKARENKK